MKRSFRWPLNVPTKFPGTAEERSKEQIATVPGNVPTTHPSIRKGDETVKRTPIRKVRTTLRKGEPSEKEKCACRLMCFIRANMKCQKCEAYTGLDEGHLHHLKAKRRNGWLESAATGQRHVWLCPICHAKAHNAGGKPCPPKLNPEGSKRGGNA